MSNSRELIDGLKRLLKTRNLTYRQVAHGLGLSEVSVKRLFASGNMTLGRLDQICLLMGLELADLVRIVDTEKRRLIELTDAQEKQLVSDPILLLVAFLIINGWTFKFILEKYKLTEAELVRYFVKLDQLKIIELLPNNRFRLLTATNFSWRKNGPILGFFIEKMKRDYFEGGFLTENEVLTFSPGMLSEESCKTMLKKLDQLVSEFNTINHQDMGLPLEKRSAYSMVVAFRPWKPDIFSKLRKPD